MCTLYENIQSLCKENGVTGGKMCVDIGVSKSLMTDLKSGRKKSINAKTAQKIADYFDVSVERVLNGPNAKKAPTPNGERKISDDDLKYALFGGDEDVTDAMWEEAKFAVELIKQRNRRERDKG